MGVICTNLAIPNWGTTLHVLDPGDLPLITTARNEVTVNVADRWKIDSSNPNFFRQVANFRVLFLWVNPLYIWVVNDG